MPVHGTMSNAEAKRRQNYEKEQLVRRKYNKFMKTYKRNKTNTNNNLNDEPAYPVNTSWAVNTNNSRSSRASSATNMYNIIDRSRHKAMWNNVFKKSRKSRKTRKQRAGNLSEAIIRSNQYFKQLPINLQNAIIAGYREAKAKGVASPNEFDTIIHLAFIKAGIPTGIQMNLLNQLKR